MIFGEYSYKDHMDVVREEAAEDARLENATNFLKETDLPLEKIALCCSLPLEQVIALADELKIES